jgi:hypothetical protein
MSLVAAAVGGGTPALANFGPSASGAIKQLAFGVGDSVYIGGHVDHDYLPGSLAYPHVHWATNGTNVQPVRWQMTMTLAKGHNQEAFTTDLIVNVEEAGSGIAWQHMVTEDTGGLSLLEPDTLVLMELERITNGGTDNADTVFGLFVDFHYQTQQAATPNRLPNFYA